MTVLLFLVALALAYTNGANDTFKGVATLRGSQTLDYRRAMTLGVVSTLLGSLLSLYLASELVRAFSGKGLVPDTVLADPAFLVSVGLGAAATLLAATLLGFPVSTTHALIGGLVGAGWVGARGDLSLEVLGGGLALPLLLSPFLAFGGTLLLYPLLRRLRLRLGVTRETCLCIPSGEEVELVPVTGNALAVLRERSGPEVAIEDQAVCVERYSGSVVGINAEKGLAVCHVVSGGAVGFARGLNDTPKIAALLIAMPALGLPLGVGLVALAMALGAILNGRRVAETMSERITDMNPGQGFTGNVVSAFLVIVASRLGLPVSTTHVTCGSIFGIGVVSGRARWKTVTSILIAWVVTLPLACLLAGLAFAAH